MPRIDNKINNLNVFHVYFTLINIYKDALHHNNKKRMNFQVKFMTFETDAEKIRAAF